MVATSAARSLPRKSSAAATRPAPTVATVGLLPPDLLEPIEFIGIRDLTQAGSPGVSALRTLPAVPTPVSRDDSFNEWLYANRLREWPLLTKDDEYRLFHRMNKLRYEAEQMRLEMVDGPRDAAALRRIRRRLQASREIRNYIVSCNLRLLVSVAGAASQRPGDLDDLVSEGQLALIRAAELFDFTRGLRFSTYATWAIRNTMSRAQQKSSRQRKRYVTGLEADHLDRPDPILAGPDFDENRQQPQAVRKLMRSLPDRERTVLELRFGFGNTGKELRFREIGEELGVSTERARQLVSRGLLRLQDLAQDAGITLE